VRDNPKTLLVTGASKGIGEACALHFARQGHTVFAGYRQPADGERLRREGGENLIPLRLDVGRDEDIRQMAAHIGEIVGDAGLYGLVNNAGVAVPGPVEFLPMAEIRRQFEVNLFGQIAVTQACMPLLRKAKGRVVNMSSVSGKFVYPFFGPYAMSKHALEAFSDALRRELLPWGMHVASIEPGSIQTPIWENTVARSDRSFEDFPQAAHEYYGKTFAKVKAGSLDSGRNGLAAGAVVRVVEKALFSPRPKARYIVGKNARRVIQLQRILPDGFFDWVVERFLYP